jgi:hypothetical protein
MARFPEGPSLLVSHPQCQIRVSSYFVPGPAVPRTCTPAIPSRLGHDKRADKQQIRCALRSSQQVATATATSHPWRPQVPTAFCMDCQRHWAFPRLFHVYTYICRYGPMLILIGCRDTHVGGQLHVSISLPAKGVQLLVKIQTVHWCECKMLYWLHVHSVVYNARCGNTKVDRRMAW